MLKQLNIFLKRILVFCVVLSIFATFGMVVSASTADSDAYETYSYLQYDGGKTAITAQSMYRYYDTVNSSDLGLSAFFALEDVCCDKAGNAYVIDSLNSRIVVIQPDGKLLKVIDNIEYDNEKLDFTGSKGLYVDKKNNLYIADTSNGRVIILFADGKTVKLLHLPESDIIPGDFQYSPVKITVDSKGYVYILSEGSYYGALLYNPQLEFCGFFGSNTVQTTIATVFENIKDLIFQTNEKLSSSARVLPYSFTDLCIGQDFIYTVTAGTVADESGDAKGQISKFSPGGTNILKANTGKTISQSTAYSFQDKGVFNGMNVRNNTKSKLKSDFIGIDVDDDGMIYTLDGTYGKIFVYDQNCNFVNVFGTGYEEGQQKGTFVKPTALAVFSDSIYITDSSKNTITIFKKTEYGKLIAQAQSLHLKGDYLTAKPLWEQVLTLDRNCPLAYRGIAKAMFLQKDYKAAKEYSKLGYDQVTYAQAFEKTRNESLTKNFVWIFVIIVVVLGCGIWFVFYMNKKQIAIIKNRNVKVALSTMTHPFDTFNDIRYKNAGSLVISIIILVLFYISVVLSNVYEGFSFKIFNQEEFNSLYSLVSSVGVVVLWSVANYAVTSLMSGKGKLKEIFIVTTYALIPQILMNFVRLFLTNVLIPTEAGFLEALSVIVLIFTAFLLCVGIMTVHEFDFFKFLGTTIVTLIAMFLVVFIIFMVFMLFQQVWEFIFTIIKELITR